MIKEVSIYYFLTQIVFSGCIFLGEDGLRTAPGRGTTVGFFWQRHQFAVATRSIAGYHMQMFSSGET